MAKNQSLAIGYPHSGHVHQLFMKSMMAFREYDGTHRRVLKDVIDRWGLYVAGNRNAICIDFLKTDAEWLLQIDTDHAFNPQTVYDLLDDADPIERPIMSALYFGFLEGDPAPMWWDLNERGEFCTMATITADVQPIAAAGMGFCLIHRGVLETMARQYQDDSWKWFGHDMGTLGGQPLRLGEDFTFFKRAAALGYQAHGDGRLAIGHMKTVAFTLQMFLKLAETRKPGEAVREKVMNGASA